MIEVISEKLTRWMGEPEVGKEIAALAEPQKMPDGEFVGIYYRIEESANLDSSHQPFVVARRSVMVRNGCWGCERLRAIVLGAAVAQLGNFVASPSTSRFVVFAVLGAAAALSIAAHTGKLAAWRTKLTSQK